jgi:hypothetical protein
MVFRVDSGRGQDAGTGMDVNRSHATNDKERSTTVGRAVEGGGSSEGRTFNHAGCYNLGHERGRAYGGYARGWQRRPYQGYKYSESLFNGSVGQGGGNHVAGQNASLKTGSRTTPQHQAAAEMENPRREVATSHSQEEDRVQKAGKMMDSNLQVSEVFKNEKVGKAKVDEGRSRGTDDKPFCFRCYKPGHGKLACTAKLWCDICGSNEHMTGRCPILK